MHRARHTQLDTAIEGGLGQPRGERIAGDKVHAAAVQQQILQMRGHPPRRIHERVPGAHRVAVDELHRRLRMKKLDHTWTVGQKRFNAIFVVACSQLVAKVRARAIDVFPDARGDCQRIARDPLPTARPRRGATVQRLLFQHDDIQSKSSGGHRGG
jgi:hypothetical protein